MRTVRDIETLPFYTGMPTEPELWSAACVHQRPTREDLASVTALNSYWSLLNRCDVTLAKQRRASACPRRRGSDMLFCHKADLLNVSLQGNVKNPFKKTNKEATSVNSSLVSWPPRCSQVLLPPYDDGVGVPVKQGPPPYNTATAWGQRHHPAASLHLTASPTVDGPSLHTHPPWNPFPVSLFRLHGILRTCHS